MKFNTVLPIIFTSCCLLAGTQMATGQQLVTYDSSSPSTEAQQTPVEDVMYHQAEVAPSSQPQELNIDEPYLWQMAAFSARQLSNKRQRYKLVTLNSATKSNDQTYQLRVTLKRIETQESYNNNKNDILYCTVQVNTDSEGQQWMVDNFGCTIPAIVRRRRPSASSSVLSSKQTEPLASNSVTDDVLNIGHSYSQPIANSIPNDLVPKSHVKRHDHSGPMYLVSTTQHQYPYWNTFYYRTSHQY